MCLELLQLLSVEGIHNIRADGAVDLAHASTPQHVAEPDEPRRSPDRWMPPSAPQIRKAGPPNQAAPTRHSRHRRSHDGSGVLRTSGGQHAACRWRSTAIWSLLWCRALGAQRCLALSGDSARRLPKIGPGCCAAEIRPDLLLRRGRIASMAKRATILKVSGLRRAFGPNTIFDKFNLEVRTGEAIALNGRNGAGKSTLLRCLVGADRPDDGSVEVCGNPM